MNKRLVASLAAVLLLVLGVIPAGAIAATPGRCVSNTTLAHAVAADTAMSPIAGTTAMVCPVTAKTRATATIRSRPTWKTLVNKHFSTEPNGYWPTGWCKYTGKDHIYGQGYYDPAHAYVRGGLLHLLSSYQRSGPNGAAWYTGGFRIFGTSSCPAGAGRHPDSALNGRITLRMRLVETGTAARGHHNVIFWPDSGTYYRGGEEDMWESQALNNARLFLHYSKNRSPARLSWRYPATFDWSRWHTFRFQRLHHVISIYVDDMTTPIKTYKGNSTTLPKTDKTWCIQQQMHNPRGMPPPSSDREDWQIASIVVQKRRVLRRRGI